MRKPPIITNPFYAWLIRLIIQLSFIKNAYLAYKSIPKALRVLSEIKSTLQKAWGKTKLEKFIRVDGRYYWNYTAPHWPLHAEEDDIQPYKGQYEKGWDAIRDERHARMKTIGLIDESWDLTPRDPRVPAWDELNEKDQAWYSRAMEVYAAQVDNMDQGIGRIMATLEATGELDNTLILFLADNGGCAEVLSAEWRGLFLPSQTLSGDPVTIGNEFRDELPGPEETYMSYGIGWANASNTPFRLFKQYDHEGGTRSPLIISWPTGIAATRRGDLVDTVSHSIDLMPTLLGVSGGELPTQKPMPFEGRSLLNRIVAELSDGKTENDEAQRPQPIFWAHGKGSAVRAGDWKLVRDGKQRWELYDLGNDGTELNNLAEEMPEKVAELKSLHEAWKQRTDLGSR